MKFLYSKKKNGVLVDIIDNDLYPANDPSIFQERHEIKTERLIDGVGVY
jgi:hypothetical protein